MKSILILLAAVFLAGCKPELEPEITDPTDQRAYRIVTNGKGFGVEKRESFGWYRYSGAPVFNTQESAEEYKTARLMEAFRQSIAPPPEEWVPVERNSYAIGHWADLRAVLQTNYVWLTNVVQACRCEKACNRAHLDFESTNFYTRPLIVLTNRGFIELK